ncbi:MAG: hypothetical protein Q9157_008388 [Trypethelium eluteriae]
MVAVVLLLQLLLGSVTLAASDITFPCDKMWDVCQNMCYHANCNEQGYDITFDIKPKESKDDEKIESYRRKNSGCEPHPNRCSTIKDHNCDEYPFGTTRRTDKVQASRGNACVVEKHNNAQGALIRKYRNDAPCHGEIPCDVNVVPEYKDQREAKKNMPACFSDCKTNPGNAMTGPNSNHQDGVYRRSLARSPISNQTNTYRLSGGTYVALENGSQNHDTIFVAKTKDEDAFEKAVETLGNIGSSNTTVGSDPFDHILSLLEVETQSVVGPVL